VTERLNALAYTAIALISMTTASTYQEKVATCLTEISEATSERERSRLQRALGAWRKLSALEEARDARLAAEPVRARK
jgi:hypothetical protein